MHLVHYIPIIKIYKYNNKFNYFNDFLIYSINLYLLGKYKCSNVNGKGVSYPHIHSIGVSK